MKILFPFLFLIFSLAFAQEWSLDRPYTLRTSEYLPLLDNLHQQTTGGDLSGIFPRRDSLWKIAPESRGILTWKKPGEYLNLNVGLGYELRALESKKDTVQALDGGIQLRGYKDSVEFWLDARIYNEDHSIEKIRPSTSWDREFLDNHDSARGEVTYTSYARYRGALAVHMGWARLSLGRDAVHWGPGYYGNMTFNQNAIPFPQMNLETKIGPLTVKSLYGDLNVDAISTSPKNTRVHDVYAHRYELQLGNQLIFGINEQTILDSVTEPFLFVPIVPLFMHKGQITEENNNGSLTFDFAWRFLHRFRFYGEYLLDDLASPVSLIKNEDVESKWGGLLGLHAIHNYRSWELGILSEYSRVEPWVYTHFAANTAQTAHQGYPLGNPLGPNSQSVDFLAYGRFKDRLYLSNRIRWWWKGTDLGSNLQDETPSQHYQTPKTFLAGAERQFSIMPSVAWSGKYLSIQLEACFIDNPSLYSHIAVQW